MTETWNNEAPTEPGYYWYQKISVHGGQFMAGEVSYSEPIIVELKEDKLGLTVYEFAVVGTYYLSRYHSSGDLWMKIVEPE